MESPEGDRIKATSSTSTPASSPAVQESPFFNYLSNLSPIKSVKTARYAQRFFGNQFPTPPPVFRSPQVDLQRETSLLKSNEKDASGEDVYGHCGNQVNTKLIPFLQNEVQPCSPSGCVDEYLNDTVELDCKASADSSFQQANDVCQLLQCGFSKPKEMNTNVNDTNGGNSENCMLMLPDQADADMPLSSLALIETSDDQNAGFQHNGGNGDSQLLPESLQSTEAYKDCPESSRPESKGSSKEATFYQRGIRRHLQFEAAMVCKGTTAAKSHSSQDIIQESENSKLPDRLTELESLILSDVETREDSSCIEAIGCPQNIASWYSFCPSEFVRSTQNSGRVVVSGPSGIGLHLNSICQSVHMGSDLLPCKKFPGYMGSEEDNLIHGGSNHLANDSDNCLISPLAQKNQAHLDSDQQDGQAIAEISSTNSQCTDSSKTLCHSLQGTQSDQQAGSSEVRTLASQNTDRLEDLNQLSPRKKRKKASDTSQGEGCKRCNCRRSKCLKLYCECFAAGVYCVDSCACENCFNKPEYEDTVLDTRQQIESRNPLAFAPKIVKQVTESPANVVEDVSGTTPASARHKRGCNCKKSKCLKKYCECYQANVGCSEACRCEGCSNSFGKKAEYRRVERWENPSINSTKAGTLRQFSPRWEELADISHLTPLALPYRGALTSASASPTRDRPKVPGAQLHQGSSLKLSAGHPHWRHSPMRFTPQVCKDSTAHEFSSDSALDDIIKDDDIIDMPEILKDTSTPTKQTKASSPNQKRVSPPQSRSQEELRSTSAGLRIGRKFILQMVPSFPPLTPYSKSKNGIGQIETDPKGDTNDH